MELWRAVRDAEIKKGAQAQLSATVIQSDGMKQFRGRDYLQLRINDGSLKYPIAMRIYGGMIQYEIPIGAQILAHVQVDVYGDAPSICPMTRMQHMSVNGQPMPDTGYPTDLVQVGQGQGSIAPGTIDIPNVASSASSVQGQLAPPQDARDRRLTAWDMVQRQEALLAYWSARNGEKLNDGAVMAAVNAVLIAINSGSVSDNVMNVPLSLEGRPGAPSYPPAQSPQEPAPSVERIAVDDDDIPF